MKPSAIGLSVKPGGSAREIVIDGGVITHGEGIAPIELHGAIQLLRVVADLKQRVTASTRYDTAHWQQPFRYTAPSCDIPVLLLPKTGHFYFGTTKPFNVDITQGKEYIRCIIKLYQVWRTEICSFFLCRGPNRFAFFGPSGHRFTMSMGIFESLCITPYVTLPSMAALRALLPWEPITIRSAFDLVASFKISSTG
jgi:hypothetical protein